MRTSAYVEPERNDEVKPVTAMYNQVKWLFHHNLHAFVQETGERVIDRDTKKGQTFVGETVTFDNATVESFRRLQPRAAVTDNDRVEEAESIRGMRLLGFKPIEECLRNSLHVRCAQYAYPDDSVKSIPYKSFLINVCRCRKSLTVRRSTQHCFDVAQTNEWRPSVV